MDACVYMLTNDSGSVLYTGVTSDICKRIEQHRNGVGSIFTRKYQLRKVVFIEASNDNICYSERKAD